MLHISNLFTPSLATQSLTAIQTSILSLDMSVNTLNRFSFDNISINCIQLALLVLDKKRIYSFFSGLSSSNQSHFTASKDHAALKQDVEVPSKQDTRVDQSICRDDMELVLRSLGMFSGSKEAAESLDSDELINMFKEGNPKMDEVKDAFDVFDKNGDGFIDAKELQSVLCALGLKQGSEIENCMRMIGVFDNNGDGRIDFDEFVKFM